MSDQPFPPEDPKAFLALCAGEWMSLRSSFELSEGDDDWHASEKGELKVSCDQGEDQSIGRLQVVPPSGHASTLEFSTDGRLEIHGGAEELTGLWRFWPDGSMELTLPQADGAVVQERIWFTRANLRLRSTTAVDAEGHPLQGSFCTDIRRVSKPAS